MKLFQVYGQYLFILVWLTTTSAADAYYAKLGCKDMCGNVRIPYPFGIGLDCSINRWYNVDCNSNSSTPSLSALNSLEILNIDIRNQTVTVNFVSMISDCRNPVRNSSQILNMDLGTSPFLFSRIHNRFVVDGCGNIGVIMDPAGSVLTGCSTTCRNDTVSDINKCLGINCCQATIPHNLKSYSMNLEGLDGGAVCGSVFLVDENSYVGVESGHVPVSLLWTLPALEVGPVSCCSSSVIELKVDVGNGTSVASQKCAFDTRFEGTPYLSNGCNDSQQCESCRKSESICVSTAIYDDDGVVRRWEPGCYRPPYEVSQECQNCIEKGGYCGYVDATTYDDGVIGGWTISCKYHPSSNKGSDVKKSSKLGVILGVSISMGVLSLVAISYALYKVIKKTKEQRMRKRFFKRNGGLLLKQQEEADPSLVDKTILFTSRELEKATDYFNENRILGRGGQGTVYKGMLVDGRIVAVKKSKVVDESQLEEFINEVVILSQVNHRNVVKLLGCCLETEVPLLVSEFISNGTLYNHIHNDTEDFPISLNMRLQIATEVASALAYLHSATSIPIYHRDVKTTNILLDEKYRAKVSDFGTSRFVSMDQTHLTTLVKGTFGYLDPEYFQSSQFTEKSDVYSFGVVLVELLTGEMPISLTRFGENRSLATHFMLAMEEGRVMSIFDAMVIKEGTRDELAVIANLAMRCLNLNGKNRPTMKEVAMELEAIRISHVPAIVQTNIGQMIYEEELSMSKYDESTSTYMSFDNSISH